MTWDLRRSQFLWHWKCLCSELMSPGSGGGHIDHSRNAVSAWFLLAEPAVTQVTLDAAEWAAENFGTCELGDARRTRRAVQVARQMAECPNGSTPNQTENWSDLKAVYRLFAEEDVTFNALAEPHWQATRRRARGVVLLIGDTTETDFGIHREVTGLGPTGDGWGRGFFLQSSLMVDAKTQEILGLAGQELFYRKPAPKKENSYQILQRERESETWGRVIDLVGPPAVGVQYIHVFDRGADNRDVFCHLVQQTGDWVIRAAQLHRKVHEVTEEGRGRAKSLRAVLNSRPLLGTYKLQVRATKNQTERWAQIEVRAAQVLLPQPKRLTAYQKQTGLKEVTQWVVEAREVNPPSGVPALHWVLWTSLPVNSLEDAWQIITYYEWRWLIEEFHKAIKTGCRLESRQYMTAHSLEAAAAINSILAVRLVQLKTVARSQPDLKAEHVIPRMWLRMLRALRKAPIKTVRDFYRHLAGLGGFLMRKRDGEPGWITLWRGTDKLLQALRGHHALK
jgi:Transposase DNA-binding/Transposase Tn5 dimerisation domain